MSNKTLLGSTAQPEATTKSAKDIVIARAFSIVEGQAIKSDAARRALDKVLGEALLGWLASSDEQTRAEVFVAIEARASGAIARKIAAHPHRPAIDPARIETKRAEIERVKAAQRAESTEDHERAQLAVLLAKYMRPLTAPPNGLPGAAERRPRLHQ